MAYLLEVNNLTKRFGGLTAVSDVSVSVEKGEIFGIYGLMGSGRSEIFDCLFGLDRPSKGEVRLFGEPISVATPADAIAHGIALVTEDRKLSGLYLGARLVMVAAVHLCPVIGAL